MVDTPEQFYGIFRLHGVVADDSGVTYHNQNVKKKAINTVISTFIVRQILFKYLNTNKSRSFDFLSLISTPYVMFQLKCQILRCYLIF